MPRKAKERAYPELLRQFPVAALVVLGIEVGGRWSEEAASFITNLARAKTRDTPAPLRHSGYRLPHRQMDSFPHPRSIHGICSQPPFRRSNPPSQSRWRSPTPQ